MADDYRPVYANDDPVASVSELRKRGMPLSVFPSCAKPNQRTDVKGCVWWSKCRMPFKGKGPQRVGTQCIPKGGKRRENIEPCYRFVRYHESYRLEGAVHRIVAFEGQEFSYRIHMGTAKDDKGQPTSYKLVTITGPIKPFPTIEQQGAVMDVWYQLQAAEIGEDVHDEELQAEALANATGTEPRAWRRPPAERDEDDDQASWRAPASEAGRPEPHGQREREAVGEAGQGDSQQARPAARAGAKGVQREA